MSASIFFCAYQVSSVAVISLSSTATHSLLNVGNRIVNVLFTAYIFADPIGMIGWLGILAAASGGLIYWAQNNGIGPGKQLMVPFLICALFPLYLQMQIPGTVDYDIESLPSLPIPSGLIPVYNLKDMEQTICRPHGYQMICTTSSRNERKKHSRITSPR